MGRSRLARRMPFIHALRHDINVVGMPIAKHCGSTSGRRLVAAEFAIAQRPCRVEKPLQELIEVVGAGSSAPSGEITFGVLDRAGQDVQLVVEVVEFRLGDDQLGLAELQFAGALAADPIPLTARLRTELTWSTTSLRREHATAPPTPRRPASSRLESDRRLDGRFDPQLDRRSAPLDSLLQSTTFRHDVKVACIVHP